MRYKICGFQVLLSKFPFRNSWRKCFQEFYASSCVVMQLSSNDYFPSIPTDTYLLNHRFNGFLPLPPFRKKRKKKTRLREGLQISTHQAVEGDSISKNLKLAVQFLSKENKPNQCWRYAGSRDDQNDWCVIFPLLRTQRSSLKTPQQENVSDLVPCNITAIKQTVNTIKPTVLNYTILFWITRSFRK